MTENFHLYAIIAQKIREDINNRVYKPGEILPSEEEFTQIFDASRTTIRNAISLLENEGYVSKHQGRGTIVKDPSITQNLNYIFSLTDVLKEKGYQVSTNMLVIEKIIPSNRVADILKLGKEEEVFWLQRTRSADGVPVAYQNNYIVTDIAPDLISRKDLLYEKGLYNLLEDEYNLEIADSIETIEMYMSGAVEKEILQLDSNMPLFLSNRTSWLSNGRVFEYVKTIIRADMFNYKVRLRGRKQPAD